MGNLEAAGRWSPQPVSDRVRAQHYDYVVVTLVDGQVPSYRGYPLLSVSIQQQVRASYRPLCSLDGGSLLVLARRAPRDGDRSAELLAAGCRTSEVEALAAKAFP